MVRIFLYKYYDRKDEEDYEYERNKPHFYALGKLETNKDKIVIVDGNSKLLH